MKDIGYGTTALRYVVWKSRLEEREVYGSTSNHVQCWD
jgi:hypothetical protein